MTPFLILIEKSVYQVPPYEDGLYCYPDYLNDAEDRLQRLVVTGYRHLLNVLLPDQFFSSQHPFTQQLFIMALETICPSNF